MTSAASTAPTDPTPSAAPAAARSRLVVVLAVVSQWTVPGLGYAILGRFGRAAAAFLTIAAMFAAGLALDGRLDHPEGGQILSWLAAFACRGVGIAYPVVASADSLGRGLGDLTSATSEFGSTFLRSAGLIAYLLVIDVYDIAVGRKA